MTNDSNPSGPELKPQFDFPPPQDSPGQSSALLSSGEMRAEFYDRDDRSYICEDNKVLLSWKAWPQIFVESKFKAKEASRLNHRYSLEYLRSHHSPGDPITLTFFPGKVSLNGGPCVDLVSMGSGGSSSTTHEEASNYWLLQWYPKEELVIVGGSSTRMKQIIFHLFDFVPFDDGSLSGETDGNVGETSFFFDFSEWEITISQNPLHKPEHVGRIQRKDGQLFDGKEVKKCIKRLGFVPSPVRGAGCEAVYLVGYDEQRQRIWEALSPPSKF